MASVRRFEDLICWQRARELVRKVYKVTAQAAFTDYSLKDQIRRAVVSILSNIAEGFERGAKEELLYFLYIAKASCGEVRAQLYIALDQRFITQEQFEELTDLAKEASALIYNFIQGVKRSGFKGLRHKYPQGYKNIENLIKKHMSPEIRKIHFPDD